MKDKILIYGADGYMGKLLLKTIQNENLELILGSKNNFISEYPIRIFSLDNPIEILKNITDVKLVINLAGPFKISNKKWIEACIKNGTHYIDISGEVHELEIVLQYDEPAKKANIMLMPGAGFVLVPTDIVANLAKQKLPDANHLKIAYVTNGGVSRGSLKTILSEINTEGVIVKEGFFQKAKPGFTSIRFMAHNKELEVVYNPWDGDLLTAKISTGIQNIETYSAFPNFAVKMMQGKLLWIRDILLSIIHLYPRGPSENQIKKGSTICYAEVSNSKGEKASAIIYGPEAYLFTALTLGAIAKKILRDDFKKGFQTPNLYGKELLKDIENIIIE